MRRDLSWMDDGLCLQLAPDLFHPEDGFNATPAVKKICARCPVKTQCLEYALSQDGLAGVWGGTTPRERARLKRRPSQALAA